MLQLIVGLAVKLKVQAIVWSSRVQGSVLRRRKLCNARGICARALVPFMATTAVQNKRKIILLEGMTIKAIKIDPHVCFSTIIAIV